MLQRQSERHAHGVTETGKHADRQTDNERETEKDKRGEIHRAEVSECPAGETGAGNGRYPYR